MKAAASAALTVLTVMLASQAQGKDCKCPNEQFLAPDITTTQANHAKNYMMKERKVRQAVLSTACQLGVQVLKPSSFLVHVWAAAS
jgi:hypothetical protein